MKRVFDLVLALMLLVPAIAICLVAAIIIWVGEGSRPLFRQTRLGRGQRPFTLLKLRTMHPSTRHAASHEIGDGQITRFGRFLRRTKVDELPQILNVLLGDMSFVGPRPCLPSQLELIRERALRDVFSLRPGITGVAQIQGLDMSQPRELAIADARYLRPWRLSRDLTCLVATVSGKGSGDAAARGAR